jgi:hypothetical protein
MTTPPQPAYSGWYTNQPEFPGLYDDLFAIAPNSPGDGSYDILFFGSVDLSRSVNSGETWVGTGDDLHGDYHAMSFFSRSSFRGYNSFHVHWGRWWPGCLY